MRVDKWPKIADVRTERADLISNTADLNPEDWTDAWEARFETWEGRFEALEGKF